MCGRAITVDDLQERLDSSPPRVRERYRDPARLRQLVEELIRFEVLLAEAERLGLDRHPDVLRARDQAMVGVLMHDEFQDAPGTRPSDIGDEEVEAYYRAHQAEFSGPERVRASQIRVDDRELGERLLSQILAAPDDAALFGRLAREHSEDAQSRARDGDLRYFARPAERRRGEPEVPPEVAEAAFSLGQIGEVYPQLVRSAEGWHIVKLTGRHEAWQRTLEEARDRIQSRLAQNRRQEVMTAFLQAARERLRVEVNQEALGLVRTSPASGTP
jgi:peptidyl-prolyl cis-trans isomerase C